MEVLLEWSLNLSTIIAPPWSWPLYRRDLTRNHSELILNYFRAKKQFSSGAVEGLNNIKVYCAKPFPQSSITASANT